MVVNTGTTSEWIHFISLFVKTISCPLIRNNEIPLGFCIYPYSMPYGMDFRLSCLKTPPSYIALARYHCGRVKISRPWKSNETIPLQYVRRIKHKDALCHIANFVPGIKYGKTELILIIHNHAPLSIIDSAKPCIQARKLWNFKTSCKWKLYAL